MPELHKYEKDTTNFSKESKKKYLTNPRDEINLYKKLQ
jgi:hypothetical protein